MTSPILYGSLISPFVRKVAALLHYKNISYQNTVLVPFIPKDKMTLLQMNPLGKVPVYQEGDFILSDSSVICAYLEKKYPDFSLYPIEPKHYYHCLWVEEYADTQLAPTILTIAFNLLFAAKFNMEPDMLAVKNALDNTLPAIFDYLNKEISNKKFIIDNRLSLADISLAVPFLNFEMAGYKIDAARWPHLSQYIEYISNQKSLVDANQMTLERFKNVIKK